MEQQQYDIRHSVYTICYLDIAGEGVNDAIVMSGRGIHILKVSYNNYYKLYFLKRNFISKLPTIIVRVFFNIHLKMMSQSLNI